MDAARLVREEKKRQLFSQLTEIFLAEQREQGAFEQVSHFGRLERAAHEMALEVSRAAQQRAVAEVATLNLGAAACPTCGECHAIDTRQRTVTGLDGPIEVLEQVAHCPACRRDFFPSA